MNRLIYLLISATILCSLPQLLIAKNTAGTTQQEQEDKRCKTKKIDLTGSYTGVLFTDKNQKQGTPATIAISNDTFELVSDTLKGAGLISGVNSCGDVSIALKFTRATDPDVLVTSISMDARVAGGHGKWNGEIGSGNESVKPIIWATAEDKAGNHAGPDIAFVICPKYPDCKRYRTCTCPEPSNKQ